MTIHSRPAVDSPFDLLRRCRRRLSVVAAVRYAGITLPIAIVSSEAMAFVGRPGPARLAILIVATIGIALGAALIAALLGAPSLRAAAAAVDGRLRLQDRIVTALQVSNDDDPMARLVLLDAASRVAGVSASQTFPLEAPAHFRPIVAAAVSISVAFAMAGAAASPTWQIDRARGGGSAVTGGSRQGRAAPPGPHQPGPSVSVSSAPRRSGGPQVAAPQVAARVTEPAVGRDLGRTPAGLGAPGSRGGPRSAAASADRDALGSAVAAGTPATGRGAVGESQGPAPVAGGVQGEPLRDAIASAAAEARPDPPVSRAYPARYRTASARAQAAIAQERVPARLNTYVKNYFIAIRP